VMDINKKQNKTNKPQQKCLGDLSKAGGSFLCLCFVHSSQPCACTAAGGFFLSQKRNFLSKIGGFVRSPFFIGRVRQGAVQRSMIRAEGGHWSCVELRVPGQGCVGKRELRM